MGSQAAPSTPSVDISGKSSLPPRPRSARAAARTSCPAGLAAQLLHALLARRQPDAAALDPAAGLAELPVELDRVHHHLRQVHRAAQLADEPGEWKVEPEVSWLRSTSTTSSQPSSARWYAIDAADSADDHAARGAGELPARPAAGRLDPVLEARVVARPLEAVEVLVAYSLKSKSSSDTPVWTTPHIASRKSDMKRNSFSVALRRSSGGSPK